MKTFEELYEMYHNGDEALYDELNNVDFENLYHECNKDLVKYYEFRCWLEDAEQYYEKNELKLEDLDPAYLYSLGIMRFKYDEI